MDDIQKVNSRQKWIFMNDLLQHKRAVIQQPFYSFGGGEGTCSSNVSIGTDYIMNLVLLSPSPPAYYGRCNVWGHRKKYPQKLPILVDH